MSLSLAVRPRPTGKKGARETALIIIADRMAPAGNWDSEMTLLLSRGAAACQGVLSLKVQGLRVHSGRGQGPEEAAKPRAPAQGAARAGGQAQRAVN